MLFSDPVFFVFFLFYLPVHLAVPPKYRIYWVILGSTIFYAYWRVDYVWLPYLLTAICWVGAAAMRRARDRESRKRRLVAAVIVLFLPLVVFKYAYFFAHDVFRLIPRTAELLREVGWLKVALPLAVSFITFTLTAYLVDVYRERYNGTVSLTTLLGYVLFFPHLIAGPILRPHELMPQLTQPRPAMDARFTLGAVIFAVGLVKKLIFADTMAGAVDDVFRSGADPTRLEYLLAIYGYSVQIYCDFSGYTDMALGLAYLLGVRLPTNFLKPYTSGSLVEFWRRWHITLSLWLRDYLYVPLGGNRSGRARQFINVLITMVLGGLWHGANWTFIVWGFMHGLGLVAVHGLAKPMHRIGIHLPRWLAVLLTFHFVTFAWIWFRSPDLATAHRVLVGVFMAPWGDAKLFLGRHVFEIILLGGFLATHRFDHHARLRLAVLRCNRGLIIGLVGLAFLFAVIISQGSSAKFIYFDF